MTKINIPSLNLDNFIKGNRISKKSFVKNLGEAYEEIGFVAIENHGLTDELTNSLYKEVKKFFHLEDKIKFKYERPELNGQRGYISFGRETAKGSTKSDLKEFWHFGQELEKNDPLSKEYEPNILCKELPNFNKVGRETFKILEKLEFQYYKLLLYILELKKIILIVKLKEVIVS